MNAEQEKPRRRRRDRGQGSVFQKGANSNTWTIQYYRKEFKKDEQGDYVLDGKDRPIMVRVRVREAEGWKTKTEAQNALNDRLSKVQRGEIVERERRQPVTVAELKIGLETQNRNNRKGRVRELPGRWKHLEPVFGTMPVSALTTDHVQRYIRTRQEEHAANATINRELATLKRMFRLGMQSTPPKVRVVPHIPMLKENNVRKGFIEDAAFTRLTAKPLDLWLRTLLELAYTYGWRREEMLGLRVSQVNLEHRSIRLEPGTTKNDEGREVAMTAKVAELLRSAVSGKKPADFVLTREPGHRPVKDFADTWKHLCVGAGLGEWICRSCDGTMTEDKCDKCSTRCKQWKYRGLILHDFRRSAAKALRRAGVPESVIMATGGWKTAAMFRRYAIVSNADQQDAMARLEKARAGCSPRVAPFSRSKRNNQPNTPTAKVQ